MKFLSSLVFIAKYILIGLGFAALVYFLMPERFKSDDMRPVEVIEPIDASKVIASAQQAVVTLQVQSKAYSINSQICHDSVRSYSQRQNACQFFNNGSGVIIDKQGLMVTSAHVVTFSIRGQVFDQAEKVLVEFANGQKTTAEIIGLDLDSDIALLKMAAKQTPYLALSDNQTQVGETIYTIGTPYMGFPQTVTSGIVSAKFFAKVSNYLQVDAQLRTGNSGGALINANGDLIGITQLSTQDVSGEKVMQNFAIAASDVAEIVKQLKVNGEVSRGWLGLNGDMSINIDSIAKEAQLTPEQTAKLKTEISNLPFGQGIVVTAVNPNGPADQAGLQELDIVTEVNGKAIYNTSDLLGAIWNKKPNDKVEVAYWRDGVRSQFEVVLGTKN
ncbi:MAG: trypsin-like peptidase domain-containing protein [Gammaproteobacteria bacterium]|nr:trypsin-like peptidase domain-containing protein [Gammaproteobacteria bacterium]